MTAIRGHGCGLSYPGLQGSESGRPLTLQVRQPDLRGCLLRGRSFGTTQGNLYKVVELLLNGTAQLSHKTSHRAVQARQTNPCSPPRTKELCFTFIFTF